MGKKIPALLLVFTLGTLLTGCGQMDERSRIKAAMVDITCNVAKAAEEAMKNIDYSNPDQAKKAEEESKKSVAKMEEILKSYDFKDQSDFEKIAEKYKDDKDLENQFKAEVKSKCNYDFDANSGAGV